MHFGYPGENTHLEHHGVSEESFWPSFTDIMMVIVMVFLLVTVAVILNNWTLISDLKNSIQAQKKASSLAANTKVENTSLEEKLNSLENQVDDLSKKYQAEQTKALTSQQELIQIRRILLEKETNLSELEIQLAQEKTALGSSKNQLSQKQQLLIAVQAKLSSSNKQNDDKTKSEQVLQQRFEDLEIEKKYIEQELAEKKIEANELVNVKNEQDITQSQLKQLQNSFKNLETSLEDEKKTVKSSKNAFENLEKTQQNLETKLQKTTQTLEQLEQEKTQLISALNTKLDQRNTQLQARDKELLAIKSKQNGEESQLRSLQGEYDTLDAKYQKLLLPARSSKGKYVVSVWYKKSGGRRVIRFKSVSTGSYKSISEKALHSKLRALKNKHKTNLYLKVVIPEKSGLSYSEAWKFTSGLQNQYDYYFQKNKN